LSAGWLDLVIVGGESGPRARPMDPDWPRSIRDQCHSEGVPFFFKQHGEWIGTPDLKHLSGGGGPGFGTFDHCLYDCDHEAVRVGKRAAGRILDGRTWDEMPGAAG
jgi:protein gp37